VAEEGGRRALRPTRRHRGAGRSRRAGRTANRAWGRRSRLLGRERRLVGRETEATAEGKASRDGAELDLGGVGRGARLVGRAGGAGRTTARAKRQQRRAQGAKRGGARDGDGEGVEMRWFPLSVVLVWRPVDVSVPRRVGVLVFDRVGVRGSRCSDGLAARPLPGGGAACPTRLRYCARLLRLDPRVLTPCLFRVRFTR
jgi:hypothetical protein